MRILLDSIVVEERIREDNGKDWDQFLASFPKFGQLQAILVEDRGDGTFKLKAGERRLKAMRHHYECGNAIPNGEPGFIEATLNAPVPLRTQLLQEFAENNERADFSFLEKAKFIRRFHETMQLDMGADAWTQELTAHSLNLSAASISHYLRVEEAAKTDTSVAKAATLDAAVKRMKVTARIKERIAEAKKDDTKPLERASALLHRGDAREWIKTIASESVDLVNFDPPWGDDASYKAAENHESFDDSEEYADGLIRALLPEIFRVLRQDRFCVFWHRLWATERMAALAESYGFNLQFVRTACIWYKPDKVADQNRFPEKQLIDAYEPFYLLRKGDPLFHEKYTHNVFAFPRVSLGSIIHPTEKPLELCEALLRLTTVPGESILDPTAGSSAILESALRNNRKVQGCELSSNYHERGIARLAEVLKTFSET